MSVFNRSIGSASAAAVGAVIAAAAAVTAASAAAVVAVAEQNDDENDDPEIVVAAVITEHGCALSPRFMDFSTAVTCAEVTAIGGGYGVFPYRSCHTMRLSAPVLP